MTTFTTYKEFLAAQAAGQKDIRFISSQPAEVVTTNKISKHLKHTVAAIQANELNYCG